MTVRTTTWLTPPAGTLPADGFNSPTTRGSLLVLVRMWDGLTSTDRVTLTGDLLPHLDSPTALSYITAAVTHWGGADAIRDGSGDWREAMAGYLTDDDRTGLEDAAEITAAEECARAAALGELDAALAADRAALAQSMQDAAAELIGALSAPERVAS